MVPWKHQELPMTVTQPSPQLVMLLEFLRRLTAFGIEWRLSPNGALLQRRGRMVAMVLIVGTRLTVSPPEDEDRHFDLEVPGDEERAVELIKGLKVRTWLAGTPATDRRSMSGSKQTSSPAAATAG